jgi:hypothetical protein
LSGHGNSIKEFYCIFLDFRYKKGIKRVVIDKPLMHMHSRITTDLPGTVGRVHLVPTTTPKTQLTALLRDRRNNFSIRDDAKKIVRKCFMPGFSGRGTEPYNGSRKGDLFYIVNSSEEVRIYEVA